MLVAYPAGHFCAEGGRVFAACLFPVEINSDERKPETWGTVKEQLFPALGAFLPANPPSEILKEATIEKGLGALRLPGEFPLVLHAGLHHEAVMGKIK